MMKGQSRRQDGDSGKGAGFQWHARLKPYMVAVGVITLLIAFTIAFSAAFGLTSLIYQKTGAPPELIRYIIAGIVGLALIAAGFRLYTVIPIGRKHIENQTKTYSALQEAMTQIAQGNFDVAIDPEMTERLQDLAVSVNEMAKSLGTLETMRQDFISNVTHEIQSPLTSIGGFAALLQNDDLPDDERKRYAAIIETESKRLSILSDNLLKLSSLDNDKIPLAMHEFRLDKQLERVALTLEPQWTAKNLTLEADLQKLTVCGDEDLLSQVWMNLLHNAVKFTPEGGRISILLISNIEAQNGKTVSVTISDTGIGIAPEDQIHIFERFYKVDKARERSLGGSGLGLSLVKKILELHGGSVVVESEPGKGTVFKVCL